jgi:MFS family permease
MITVSPAPVRRLLPEDPILRTLTWVTLVNTLGNGMFYTTSALFFTRSVGLSAAQLGLALALAGVCGVLAGVPMGRLSDRWGARRTLVTLVSLEAVGMLGYAFTHSFVTLVPLLCAVTFVDRGASTVRNALMGDVLAAEVRVRGRSYLRAVTNVGIGAGSAIAAIALHYDTRAAYLTMVVANAATFLFAALLLGRLPGGRGTEPAASIGRSGRRALRDGPYLLVTALTGVLALQFGVMEVGIPLWVVHDTHAPRLVISAVLVLNTVIVVLLQVRASRGTEDPRQAARICARSGVLLAAGCVAFGCAHGVPAVVAVVVLLVGAVLQTFGEILSSAAGWALGYDLAAPGATGEYQGVFNTGFAAGMLLSPLLITNTALRFGLAGWSGVGAIFLVAGAALIPATRWALTRNQP